MKLDTYKSGTAVLRNPSAVAYASCPVNKEYPTSTWVHLLELPSPYSYDEALLICKHSEDEWLTWIPDHGEAVLYTSQFCFTN